MQNLPCPEAIQKDGGSKVSFIKDFKLLCEGPSSLIELYCFGIFSDLTQPH